MAKKSTGNKLKVLWNGLTVVLGALLLAFIALPHVKLEVSTGLLGGASEAESYSGYSLISFQDGYDTGVAVVLLLLVIFASLLVLSAVVKTLCDAKVIKNATVLKVASWATMLLSVVVAVLAIVNIITISSFCSSVENKLFSAGKYAMWGSLIVNAIIAVATVPTSVLSLKK